MQLVFVTVNAGDSKISPSTATRPLPRAGERTGVGEGASVAERWRGDVGWVSTGKLTEVREADERESWRAFQPTADGARVGHMGDRPTAHNAMIGKGAMGAQGSGGNKRSRVVRG